MYFFNFLISHIDITCYFPQLLEPSLLLATDIFAPLLWYLIPHPLGTDVKLTRYLTC